MPGKSLSKGDCNVNGPDLSADFHTYAVDWQPGGVLTWYFDGKQTCQRFAPGYFKGPMFLILNTAIGGHWPGPPAAGTHFPQQMGIDYVHVYQKG